MKYVQEDIALGELTVPVTEGRRRVVIERVQPAVDCGRFPIKRVVGDSVTVEADVFADGHDELSCQILFRQENEQEWQSSPMKPLGNDRWSGEFQVSKLGRCHYSVEGWIDRFRTWRGDLVKRINVGQDVHVELLIGAQLVEGAVQRASGEDAIRLGQWARTLRQLNDREPAMPAVIDEELGSLMQRYPDRSLASRCVEDLAVVVDREKARFSAWYELFPRSCSPQPSRHGMLRDCEAWLPYIASMGFDVVYLPPVHPIGRKYRKGKNNSVTAQPDDVGSPWAIGSIEGGHKAVHPELGTLEDFRHFASKAAQHGLAVALDIAVQCSPDH